MSGEAELRLRIEALRRSMRALVALVESPSASDGAIERAIAACDAQHAVIDRIPWEGVDELVKSELQLALAELACWNALALAKVERDLEATREQLSATRRARTTLREYRSHPEAGGACDVAG